MRLFGVIIFIILGLKVSAHNEPEVALMQLDSLVVDVNEERQYVVLHQMLPKQTLYSISKFYQVELNDLYVANPELIDRIVKSDEVIRIPLKNYRVDPSAKNGPKVYYRVKAKETLFRVARIYFDMTIDNVKNLNGLESNELDIGQDIQVGRLAPMSNLKPLAAESTDSISLTESMPDFTGQLWIEDKNIAFWLKDANPDHSHVVLHNSAPVNSWVAITNPMYGKTVNAKVIGRIPEKVYPSDIDVILSHGVAESLGAIDARFYVKLKHLKVPRL